MDIEELKQEIEDYTGIPADSLTGETAEENIAQAKALLAYKREQGKTTRDQFTTWMNEREGKVVPDLAGKGLAEIEARIGVEASSLPDNNIFRAQFAEWFKNNFQ